MEVMTWQDALIEDLAHRLAERVVEKLELVLEKMSLNPQEDDGALLDVQEAAAKLSLAPSTVYRLSREGKIPSLKIGSTLRFRTSDLSDFLCSRARGSQRVQDLARSARAHEARDHEAAALVGNVVALRKKLPGEPKGRR
jgi:excisionase family DNA binding protein